MTDHFAESQRLIGATDTRDWNEPSPYVDRRIAAAQVHAVLALAEQQRIANLLSAVHLSFGPGNSDITKPWTTLSDSPKWEAIRSAIARTLRIEKP